MKICKSCGKVKPTNDYPKNPAKRDGRENKCKKCILHMQRARRYKISVEELNKLLNTQNCAICSTDLKAGEKNIDHDHDTGRIREVLCSGCNKGLGFFKDDVSVLTSAIKYLIKHATEAK